MNDELFKFAKDSPWKKRRLWIAGAAAVSIALAVWYFGWYGYNPRVDSKASEIAGAAQTAERRADAVMDSVRHREVTARVEAHKKISALPADAIVDALAALLAQSRREK